MCTRARLRVPCAPARVREEGSVGRGEAGARNWGSSRQWLGPVRSDAQLAQRACSSDAALDWGAVAAGSARAGTCRCCVGIEA